MISRAQEPEQLYAKGGIASIRQPYFLGKAVKKLTKGVKKIAKSPIGKAALLYAGTAGLGNLAGGLGGAQKWGGFGWLRPTNVMSNLGGLFGAKGKFGNLFHTCLLYTSPSPRD